MNWPNVSTSEPSCAHSGDNGKTLLRVPVAISEDNGKTLPAPVAIVLDMGGVLVDFDPDAITAGLIPGAPFREDLTRDLFGSPEWLALDRGSLSTEEALTSFTRRHTDYPADVVGLVLNDWPQVTETFDWVEDFISLARQNGLRLVLLSNANEQFPQMRRKNPWFESFDYLCLSHQHGLLKPDLDFYRLCLKNAGFSADEVVFVDDKMVNIEAAGAVGIQGIHFHGRDGVAPLLRHLEAIGIHLAE